ncbi:MerR family transcriptional regulator [Bacillus horti]|uniref:DNA-binding transcriptional MerR regulator n=1 Tax=Caldalkalibacillus horti TaxID=77523 RepID=A0ABT9W1U1_9BACI|nr:MerR family transcriptional regulator [Bacillus horti]MDQ0167186.1 DNA-binding transcriptional MerR regulator [Bacillus horti]
MGEGHTYRTSQLSEILGISRDALRYYEEQGVVKPKQKETNQYRQYDFYDIYALLVTDFYKKRNLSIKEVRKLQAGSEIEALGSLLEEKAKELEETIRIKEYMLQKINETKEFCNDVQSHLNQYSIRKLPTYEVVGEISDFNAFGEYPAILENMDAMKDDILSKIIRSFTFDENGFLDSSMYIVEKTEANLREKTRSYLEYSRCIYTIVEDGRFQNGNEDVKQKVFQSTLAWGENQGLKPMGVAFATTRLITYLENKERVFLEIYIPVEEK